MDSSVETARLLSARRVSLSKIAKSAKQLMLPTEIPLTCSVIPLKSATAADPASAKMGGNGVVSRGLEKFVIHVGSSRSRA